MTNKYNRMLYYREQMIPSFIILLLYIREIVPLKSELCHRKQKSHLHLFLGKVGLVSPNS